MVWTFIILGLLTSAWSLYALIASFVSRQDRRIFHAAAVALLAAAWTLGHQTGLGRLALIAAIVIECVAPFRRGKPIAHADVGSEPDGELDNENEAAGTRDDSAREDDAAAQKSNVEGEISENEVEAEPPPPPEPPPALEAQPLSSSALLATPWTIAPSVFHASLRRGGRRDAVLLDDESDDDTLVVSVGDIRIEIRSVAKPCLRSQVNAAARLAWEWPEASQAVRNYAAHVAFTTIAPEGTPARDLVHLHHRAQAALAEFTNVVAIFWPEAGRLTSPANLPDLIGRPNDAAAMSASCLSFRVFEPQEEGGPYVLDTAGLHVFGLPDVQAFAYAEPDDSISAMLYELAERLFSEGEAIEPDTEIRTPNDRIWQVELRWSNREPRRPVLSLTCEEDQPEPQEQEVASSDPPEVEFQTPSDETFTDDRTECDEAAPRDTDEGSEQDEEPPESMTPLTEERHADAQHIDDPTPTESRPDQDDPEPPASGSAS